MDEWRKFKTMKISLIQLQYPLTWHERCGGGCWQDHLRHLTFFFGGGKEAFDEARLEINLDFIASCLPNHEFEQMVI